MSLDIKCRQEVETGGVPAACAAALDRISTLTDELEAKYGGILSVNDHLNRSLVSFRENSGRPFYRWFKYKEAFSAGLVEYLLQRHSRCPGVLLDPFAGIGTAMFAAAEAGWRGEGIELLPIGQQVIETKQYVDWRLTPADTDELSRWAETKPWREAGRAISLCELRITRGAYPADTVAAIESFLSSLEGASQGVRGVLLFALLCVLERISYTRKDGQYLRWDHRSGRRTGNKVFDKGRIVPLDEAITAKLREIVSDLRAQSIPSDLFGTQRTPAEITLHRGTCLELLPAMPDERFDCVLTSPPYCNRYDYTRTYALELALLGVDEAGLVKLRQEMLSCTVENRAKDLLAMNPAWADAIQAADSHDVLQAVLTYLDQLRRQKLINNNGIPRMVRGYFYEMACVVAECARVLKQGAPLIMVNDNVRYAGASIPVDLILSDFANSLGFEIEHILVLPIDKGNSSQQMGAHGRQRLRKCVYIWRKK